MTKQGSGSCPEIISLLFKECFHPPSCVSTLKLSRNIVGEEKSGERKEEEEDQGKFAKVRKVLGALVHFFFFSKIVQKVLFLAY